VPGWVIPVGGSWRLMRGGIYRWTIRIEQKCALGGLKSWLPLGWKIWWDIFR